MQIAREYRSGETAGLARAETPGWLSELPVAAYTCDGDGLITSFNHGAVEIWGRAPKLNDRADRYCGSLKLLTAEGEPMRHDRSWMALALHAKRDCSGLDAIVERPDGRRRKVMNYIHVLRDARGMASGAVNLLVDVTDRERADDLLREAEKQNVEFLSILSNELRNPLVPLRNAMHLLALDSDDEEVRSKTRTMLQQQLQQLTRRIGYLMDTARLTHGNLVLERARVDVVSVLNGAIDEARALLKQSGHIITATVPSGAVHADGDKLRLAQVFTTLLAYAAKYMLAGSTIWVSALVQDGELVIEIKDTGPGLPAISPRESGPQLVKDDNDTDPHRAQRQLRAGANQVEGILNLHNGTVHAYCGDRGCSSSYVVRLPILAESGPVQTASARTVSAEDITSEIALVTDREKVRDSHANTDDTGEWLAREFGAAAARSATSHEPSAADRMSWHKAPIRRILVADHSASSAARMCMVLNSMGHQTRMAHSARSAMAIAEKFRPDIVFLDVDLPRPDGYSAAAQIRKQPWGKGMILIAVMGFWQEDAQRKAVDAGFDLHMTTPIAPGTLERMLAGLKRRFRISMG